MEDKKKLEKLVESCHYLTVQPIKGNPPAEYILTFKLRGYIDVEGNTRDIHQVRLLLPSGYPISAPPSFQFINRLWHPNVYLNGDVCLGFSGSNWKPSFRIDELVVDLAKYICLKEDSYNLKSLANSSCNAAWITSHTIPIDNTNILPVDKPKIVIKEKKNIDIKITNSQTPMNDNLQEKIKIRINEWNSK
ncbi:MAG: ubiquitin-conjugating enzyme E2 [Candidatus Omnitrophota bacterium]